MMVSTADRLFTERKSSSEASAVSSLSAQSLLMIADAFRALQKHVSPMKVYLFICMFSEHRFTPAFFFFLFSLEGFCLTPSQTPTPSFTSLPLSACRSLTRVFPLTRSSSSSSSVPQLIYMYSVHSHLSSFSSSCS